MSPLPSGGRTVPVSVIIPVHNGAAFLRAAMESVHRQTCPPEEVIVVDDGSVDGSGQIARAAGARVLTLTHEGPSGARNAAIRQTGCPWIAFLDADDLWEPDKLERQWAAVRVCPDVGAVFTDAVCFSNGGITERSFLARRRNYARVERTTVAAGIKRCQDESLRLEFLKGNFILPSTLLVRRQVLMDVGLFDPDLTHMEDRDLFLRLVPVCSVAVVEEPLIRCRIHAGALTNDVVRMALAPTQIAARVFAHPERYPKGAVAYYRATQATLWLNAGRFTEEFAEVCDARRYYLAAWRHGGGARPLALFVLCHCPRLLRVFVRGIVHRLVPKGGRRAA